MEKDKVWVLIFEREYDELTTHGAFLDQDIANKKAKSLAESLKENQGVEIYEVGNNWAIGDYGTIYIKEMELA